MKIQIPKISIDLDTSKPASEVTILSVGLGLHQGWTYTTMYGSKSVFNIPGAESLHGYTWFFLVSIVAFALFLVSFGLTDQHMRKKFVNKGGLFLGTGCMFVSTVLACCCSLLSGQQLMVVSIIAGVVSGFGSAIVFIFWGIAMSLLDYQSIVLNASLSILIIAGIYVVVMQIVPAPFCGAIACILPLGEAFLLLSMKPSFFYGESRVPVSTPLPIRRFSFAWHLVLPLAFFGMAAGLIKGNAIMKPMESASTNIIPLLLAAGVAFIYVTSVLSTAGKGQNDVDTFKRVIPLVAIGTICIPFMITYDVPLLDVVVVASFFSFEIFFFIFLNTLSQGYRLSPVYIYGLGRGTLAIAALLGSVITIESEHIVNMLPWGDSGGTMITLLCLVLGFCSLPSRSTIEHAALNTCSLTFYYKRGEQGGGLGSAKLTDTATAEGILPRAMPASTPQRTAAATAAEATEGERHATGTIDDPIPQQELLQAQCEAIANCYLLSQRETEVFYYLAKGYNSARIQEILYISEGTAKTHIRHIYRKLDIHSQQELIRMVDETLE